MKKTFITILVTCGLFLLSQSAIAGGTVRFSGNLSNKQCIVINLDWMLDTAEYHVKNLRDARDAMYDNMWKKILPGLVERTKGYPISYDKSEFTLISENDRLVSARADGSLLYHIRIKVKFGCSLSDSLTGKKKIYNNKKDIDTQFHYRFRRMLR